MPRTSPSIPKTPTSAGRPKATESSATKRTSEKKKKLNREPTIDLSKLIQTDPEKDKYGFIEGETTLRITPEKVSSLRKAGVKVRDYISENIDLVNGYLELVGWSGAKPGPTYLPESIYKVFELDIPIKQVAFRGPGKWHVCRCPEEGVNKCGDQIDLAVKKTLSLKNIYIFRPFSIAPCALLDLISRSPDLKTIRNYGTLFKGLRGHHQPFESVRFPSNLEGVYWPWCNRKYHLPTLKTIVSRHDQIISFYCDAETICDFVNADKLLNVKYLSLNLNEEWNYRPPDDDVDGMASNESISEAQAEAKANRMRNKRLRKLWNVLPERTAKLANLARLQNVEALEIRTYDIIFSEEENDEISNERILEHYESYQLKFWECVSKMRSLKYLAIYGTWDFEKVARELAKHGIQIEYLKSNLYPSSLIQALREDDGSEDKITRLNMNDSTRHLVKLAKLKSFHYMCQELLADFHLDTKSALKDISDILWKMDCKVSLTKTLEECLSQLLRRGNQSGRSYRITLVVDMDDGSRFSFVTEQKFSAQSTIKERLHTIALGECKKRGSSNYRAMSVYGIEQAAGLHKGPYEQLKAIWDGYDEKFKAIDRFV